MGSTLNADGMIYSRGPSEEYDRMARISGDSGWSWDSLQKYICKNERYTPPWNNRSNVGEFDPRVHGYGPLLTGLTPTVFEHDLRVIQTTSEHPDMYPFNLDVNSGDGLGFGWLHTTVGHGARSTSSSAYLHPALSSRSNVDLLLHSQVTKLVETTPKTFNSVQAEPPRQRNVIQPLDGSNGCTAKLSNLSAGAIGTPQILMLSGIGPANHLASVGVASTIDLPDVGNNLQDQAILTLQYEINGTTLSPFLNNGIAAGNTVVNTIGYLRLPSKSPLLKMGDPAAGPNSAHYQIAFLGTFYPNKGQTAPATGNWMSISIVVQSPTSRGEVKLASSSAFTHPSIDPAYFTTAFDIGTAIQAIRTAHKFITTSAWDGFIIRPYVDAANLTTGAQVEAYIRKFSSTLYHPTSTAKISKKTDKGGVVGPDLRVVDASILPAAAAGFPQAEVYIIAERAADLVKETWGLS
ncbi:aryl-alcohol oxidase-like protein [Mycena olivaceomarginata]|nr:aryl-alcohol oxidase-like protein [Mycena olivaceomarginata]